MSVKLVGFIRLPLVPATVTEVWPVYVGGGPVYVDGLYAEVSVRVVVPDVLADVKAMEAGEKPPVTPVGNALAENVTVPLKP